MSTMSITETVRARIKAAPSLRRLSIRSGLDRAQLRRFRDGEQSLTLASLDRLAEPLSLTLTTAVATQPDAEPLATAG